MRTVRDFKNFVLKETGDEVHFSFMERSEEHRIFWEKLNRLGARNIKTLSPEKASGIDATVELSDAEWAELEAEFRQL